jgi:hypothetical protein
MTLCEVSVRSRISAWMFLLFCLGLFPAFAPSASAQRQSQPPAPAPKTDVNMPPITDADEAQARITSELAKKAAKERVAAIKSDTDKLLRLSVELKQSVEKSDENVLSLDVIKKAEEIEKLARSVKEKMKGPN